MHLETRLSQLDSAIHMELWQVPSTNNACFIKIYTLSQLSTYFFLGLMGTYFLEISQYFELLMWFNLGSAVVPLFCSAFIL